MENKMGYIFLIIFLSSAFYVALAKVGIHNLFVRQDKEKLKEVEWLDLADSPLGEKDYTPQGIAFVNGKILLANTWKNKKSRVYEYDPESVEILRYFDMPDDAVHTSGLSWDGEFLYAVDYKSNKAYCINVEPSFKNKKAQLIGSFDTTLKGTSACCIVPIEDRKYLAISDFTRTRKTIIVDFQKALEERTAMNSILTYYLNDGFSQGLEYIAGYLYESENKKGIDVINKMDISLLLKTKDARKSTVVQFNGPSKGVEDLAWDGKYLWTSDESVFKVFKAEISEISGEN